ncbi:hypothetical protein SKAU_G00255850 [Synaphobranchus kaupii]|uniref:Uncharacterized protein n=1 Tax=Synaphobranchus kaupii TaxID=118154 RepID=A0A9Q1F422_SYNKA|nr:hypothetical protein SKAU_G00255850 [Synaphobranchus kaupii]
MLQHRRRKTWTEFGGLWWEMGSPGREKVAGRKTWKPLFNTRLTAGGCVSCFGGAERSVLCWTASADETWHLRPDTEA